MLSLFLSQLFSSIFQVLLFSLIPFIWWFVTARKNCSFFEWIGIKKIRKEKLKAVAGAVFGISVAFMVLSVFMLNSVKGVEMATSAFTGLGVTAIPAVIVYAAIQTALSEEIIFRGFILKRISNRFGSIAGNLIQSLLFGLMHGILLFGATGIVKALIVTVFTAAIGWSMGFINEKTAEGSIIPGWCIHTIANVFSGLCAAFMVFQ